MRRLNRIAAVVALTAMAALSACSASPVAESTPAPTAKATAKLALEGAPFIPIAAAPDLDPDPAIIRVELTAAAHGFSFGDMDVQGFAYNGQVPGPTLRATVGQTLIVDLTNDLDAPTTIHWHGLEVPFAMDGVAWQGAPVPPGGTFQYSFVLNQAGTFWYHPHIDTDRQVDWGLYGVLIVDPAPDAKPATPTPDLDIALVFDGWGESAHDYQPPETGALPVAMNHEAIALWTVNGAIEPVVTAPAGSIVRARLLNVANAGYLDLRWPDMRVIGGDQGINSNLDTPDRILLAPGDRVEVEWRVGGEGFEVMGHPRTLHGGSALGPSELMLSVRPSETGAPLPKGLKWPFKGKAPTVDPGHADIVYTFTGSNRSRRWLINGESFPDVTIHEVALGQDVVVEVRNLSPTNHPFHMHGHAFEVLSINGVAPKWRQIEDTIDLGIRDRVRLRFTATNPGDWMTHCHILPHADRGMMTVLRVTGE